MNDSQIDALQIVLNNPTIYGAVKQVFAESLKEITPEIGSESDEVVGQKYRAYTQAKKLVEGAFKQMETYRRDREEKGSGVRHI